MLTEELIVCAPEASREHLRRVAYAYQRLRDEAHDLQEERVGEHTRCTADNALAARQLEHPGVDRETAANFQRRIGERTRQRDERVAIIARREEAVAADLRARGYLSAVAEILRQQRSALVRNEPKAELRHVRLARVHGDWKALLGDARAQIDHCKALSLKVAEAPPTSDELKRALSHELDLAASPPALNLSRSRNERGSVEAPFDLHALLNPTTLVGGATVGDHGGRLFAWLHRDELQRRFFAIIDAADLRDAMPADRRARELDRLRSELLKLERYEEAIIDAAEAEGLTLARRPDVDPLVILRAEWVR